MRSLLANLALAQEHAARVRGCAPGCSPPAAAGGGVLFNIQAMQNEVLALFGVAVFLVGLVMLFFVHGRAWARVITMFAGVLIAVMTVAIGHGGNASTIGNKLFSLLF